MFKGGAQRQFKEDMLGALQENLAREFSSY
jgi:hypothetical protein